MKKLIFALVMVVAACSTSGLKYGQGGQNACQYVKEQVPGLRDDIAKIEVTGEDSLLSDIFLIDGDVSIHKAEVDYYEKRINREQLDSIIRAVSTELNDVEWSWRYDIVNDSLRKLDKYSYRWCKVYKIRVTMKSGITKEPRVVMEDDGITPRCMERDVEENIKRHSNELIDVVNNIVY